MSANSSTRIRFVVLDFYRFLAALGVMLFHVNAIDPQGKQILDVGAWGMFVDFFFILSGFVLYYNYAQMELTPRSYWNFMVKRIARIYPLHLATLLFLLIYIPLLGVDETLPKPDELVANVLLIHAWGVVDRLVLNAPSWSISAEFFCYLLCPFILLGLRHVHLVVAALLAAGFFFVMSRSSMPMWQQGTMYGANYDFGMLRALPSFVIGCILARILAVTKVESSLFLLIGTFAFIGSGVLSHAQLKPLYVMLLFCFSILFTAIGERSLKRPLLFSSALEVAGDTSYGVYMIHGLMFHVLLAPLWRYLAVSLDWLPLYMFLACFFTTFIAHLIFRYFEWPARDLINKTLYRKHLRTA